MRKTLIATFAVSIGLLTSNVALANDAVIGALIGGGAGAVIGNAIGGRNATVLGSVIGAAAGAAIGSEQERPRHYDRRVEYYPQPQTVYSTQTYYPPQTTYYPQQQVYYAQPPVRVVAPPTVYISSGYYDDGHRRRHHRHNPNW